MNRWLGLLLVLALLPALAGCGDSKDRGKYKDLDKPRSVPTTKKGT